MTTTFQDIQSIATEIADLARPRGILLNIGGVFSLAERMLFLWRDNSTVHYNLQGRIVLLPEQFRESASAFHGGYNEQGSVLNLEQAVELVIAWIVHRREVHALPFRCLRSSGIG